jgi:hypothetical protein
MADDDYPIGYSVTFTLPQQPSTLPASVTDGLDLLEGESQRDRYVKLTSS